MTRKAGRPPSTSVGEIVTCAFDLFLRLGYDATTFDDLATALGVSRRTLFHYFPNKERLVWHEHEQTLDTLRAHLRSVDAKVAPFVAMRSAIVATVTYAAEDLPFVRKRFLLIDRTPSLRATSVFDDWRDVLAADAARRLGGKATAFEPQLLAGAAQSATLSGLSSWAQRGKGFPHAVVDDALGRLAAGLATIVRR